MDETGGGAAPDGASSAQAASLDGALAQLAAWRGRGADRVDPVRFGFIEALARRTAAHQGAARRVLDDRLRGLLAAYGETLGRRTGAEGAQGAPEREGAMGGSHTSGGAAEVPAAWRLKPARQADPEAATAHHSDDGPPHAPGRTGAAAASAAPKTAQPPKHAPDRGKTTAPRGALAALVDEVSRRNNAPAGARLDGAAPAALPGLGKAPELKALSQFRSTWSKLSADQRLKQSLARLPGNAGPLNSHQLVHRSLVLMRDVSPQYLHLFMSYVDALSWLTDAQDSGPAPISANNHPPGRRKP